MPATTEKLSAVDYFKAKLQFESTPYALKTDMEQGRALALALDVRPKEAFDKEHIPGARNIPLAELDKELASLPKGKTIVAYCGNITCALAPKAALRLAEKGFPVQSLFGGIEEWKKKFPVEGKK